MTQHFAVKKRNSLGEELYATKTPKFWADNLNSAKIYKRQADARIFIFRLPIEEALRCEVVQLRYEIDKKVDDGLDMHIKKEAYVEIERTMTRRIAHSTYYSTFVKDLFESLYDSKEYNKFRYMIGADYNTPYYELDEITTKFSEMGIKRTAYRNRQRRAFAFENENDLMMVKLAFADKFKVNHCDLVEAVEKAKQEILSE